MFRAERFNDSLISIASEALNDNLKGQYIKHSHDSHYFAKGTTYPANQLNNKLHLHVVEKQHNPVATEIITF